MSKNTKRLITLSEGKKSRWLQHAIEREAGAQWAERSMKVALNVLEILRQKNMSKQELAQKMSVSAQYVSKIVKGHENLTFETISKIEKALDVQMIEVRDFSEELKAQAGHWTQPKQSRTAQSNTKQDARFKLVSNVPSFSYAC